jgi:ketosteroid isomerase-like protein
MSREDVEIVREAREAFTRRDNESALRLYGPEVELHGGLDGSVVYRGVRGVREFFRDWLDAWDEWGSGVEDWIDTGNNVIAMMHTHGRGKQSGVPVERRQAHVWTLREGQAVAAPDIRNQGRSPRSRGAKRIGDGGPHAPRPSGACASQQRGCVSAATWTRS